MNKSSIHALPVAQNGREYWRSLEELADTPEFREFLYREFPLQASEWRDNLSRRKFLTLMGASLALAGVSGCNNEQTEKIVPYVRAPEHLIPGKPLYFATAMSLGHAAAGLLVESHMGRPTKIEGNPEHPASQGATDLFSQASILSLYDPDRSQVILHDAQISTWDAFLTSIRGLLDDQRATGGQGVRLLTQTVTSPTLAWQIRALLQRFPQARWHQYEPVTRDNAFEGARLAFGRDVNVTYRFDQANVVLSLDHDFLACTPENLRSIRDFMDRRRVRAGNAVMNRMYAIESMPSHVGAVADHRLPLRPTAIGDFARQLARRLELAPAGTSAASQGSGVAMPGQFDLGNEAHAKFLDAVVDDLTRNRGACLVLAGDSQPPAVHALAHAMNAALGNVGTTVIQTEPVAAEPINQTESLRALVDDLESGAVELLFILDGNPVFDAPSDFEFSTNLQRARTRVHLSYYQDETSALCQWHVPQSHYLESWGDTRAVDGTVTIQQPLIQPLFQGRSTYEFLSALVEESPRPGMEIINRYWQEQRGADGFDRFWKTALHDGIVPDTALPGVSVAVQADGVRFQEAVWNSNAPAAASGDDAIELIFRPDPTIWDGRFANNGWLQELPKPLSKLTWDNVAHLSPAMAQRLGLSTGDVVEMKVQDRTVTAPVWIMPGHADGAVTVHFGYGRTSAGRVGNNVGFDAYRLRTADAMSVASGLRISKTGARYPLASTQTHWSMEGRDIVRSGTLDQYREDPLALIRTAHHHAEADLYPDYKYDGHAWGMVIDQTACTGCSACVVACQAENNIPIVGKEGVISNREMHWLRIDTYFGGEPENPDVYLQPMMCVHCERAPCEVVCPVAATVHSSEGLNDMVYNRCVGTRYCSNNCPYKVRRFNFLAYTESDEPLPKMQYNPDVTVRSRGVMEKCTYCVQRISAARIHSKTLEAQTGQERRIQDGEVVTACQAACPARAITFGDINDPVSQVAKLKAEPINYGVLEELNTKPRTTYLARVRNPHPSLVDDSPGSGVPHSE